MMETSRMPVEDEDHGYGPIDRQRRVVADAEADLKRVMQTYDRVQKFAIRACTNLAAAIDRRDIAEGLATSHPSRLLDVAVALDRARVRAYVAIVDAGIDLMVHPDATDKDFARGEIVGVTTRPYF